MTTISPLAESLPTSGIRDMMARAALLDGLVHLEVGEPGFQTPDHIVEAAFQAVREGATRYTPSAGVPALREAVAERVSARWGRPVGAAQVMITAGAVSALSTSVLATVGPGDELLLPDPGWPNYNSMAQLCGAVTRTYPLPAENGFVPDPDQIARLVTPRTRAMIINTPGNPTGAVFGPDVVRALVELSERHGFQLIADEIYEDLVFGAAHESAAREGEGAIYVSGCSKTYAMTGWRLGWAVAPEPVVRAMEKLVEPLVSCASSVSQAAADAALRGPQDCVAEMREAYQRRRDLVVDTLGPAGLLPVPPEGGFFALVDLGATGLKGMELALEVLDDARVATVPGAGFGTGIDSMVRISFAAADEDVAEGCARLLAFHERRGAHQPIATPSLRGSEPPA